MIKLKGGVEDGFELKGNMIMISKLMFWECYFVYEI